MAIEVDVCVVGGGPSGSAFALRMARLGYRVLVVERHRFPRRHVGEALTPGVWPLLETLDLREEVEAAGFVPAAESLVRWEDRTTRTVTTGSGEPGFNVDRGRFDQVLLDGARAAGAAVLQPAWAGRPSRTDSGWAVPVRLSGGKLLVEAAFVADASGRASVLGGSRRPTSAPTIALCGTWECPPAERACTVVEAGSHGWFWGSYVPHGAAGSSRRWRPSGVFSAMAFVDRSWLRHRKVSGLGLEVIYRELMGTAALFHHLAAARLTGPVVVCDATSYADQGPVGPDFIKLGEASFAIDPLSSSGVQKGLQTALSGSVVSHTLLSKEGDRRAAIEFYRDSQSHSVRKHADWATGCYQRNEVLREEPFWTSRAWPPVSREPGPRPPTPEGRAPRNSLHELLSCPVRLADDVALVETPCIAGERVERRPALSHPSLTRPVVWLGGVELAPLLRCLERGPALPDPTLEDVMLGWAEHIPMDLAVGVADWLSSKGILARV